MNLSKENRIIADHYRIVTKYYQLFWGKKAHSLHHGYYDKNGLGIVAAQLNKNKFLADLVGIKPHSRILDAGCGIGGSSVWLAKERGAIVTGVNISPLQIKKAKLFAEKEGVTHNVQFIEADYCQTGLSAESFDVVWALDAVCHTQDKQQFIKEAFRLLKPGGKLLVSDGYLSRPFKGLEDQDKILIKNFCIGFGSMKEISIGEFLDSVKENGFENVGFTDITKQTLPDFDWLYYPSRICYPILKFFSWLGLISHYVPLIARTGYLYKIGYGKKLAVYGVVTAQKSNNY